MYGNFDKQRKVRYTQKKLHLTLFSYLIVSNSVITFETISGAYYTTVSFTRFAKEVGFFSFSGYLSIRENCAIFVSMLWIQKYEIWLPIYTFFVIACSCSS